MSQQSFFHEPAPGAPARVVVRPAAVSPPAVGERRVRLTLAYDGAAFHGFASTPGVDTVQARLTAALATVLRRPDLAVTGAGRTDAGVHARGQVVSFDAPAGTDLARLERSVNALCAPGVVVREAAFVGDDFDARFSALWRHYRYTVLNRRWADPILRHTSWHVPGALDLAAMRLGCDAFIGEHDFSSFCRRPPGHADGTERSLVRRIASAEWHELGDGLVAFEIRGTAFCHQMVRSITGTLVEVGLGRRRAGELLGVLRARDRAAAGNVAPPQGLCLTEVGYP
jgi:tRNA pseudouridine38-40 synthase